MYDLNDAEPQRGSIIDPCFAKLVAVIRPGGVDGPAPTDRGLLKRSKQIGSDVLMLDFEFTVAEGRYTGRKFWQTMTVSGGDVDEKGQSKGWNITKSILRAMIDSALGINPKDLSDVAKQRRQLRGFADLSGIAFIGKIGVKKDKEGKYPDQNILAHVVTPDEKEWQQVMSGQEVLTGSPQPPAAQPPAWGQTAWNAPAQAQPAAPTFTPPPFQGPQPQGPSPTWPHAGQTAPAAPIAPAAHPQAAPGWPTGGWPPAGSPPPAATPTPAPTAPMAGPAWLNS